MKVTQKKQHFIEFSPTCQHNDKINIFRNISSLNFFLFFISLALYCFSLFAKMFFL